MGGSGEVGVQGVWSERWQLWARMQTCRVEEWEPALGPRRLGRALLFIAPVKVKKEDKAF